VKQRLGRVFLVWLHPGIERAIPVRATNLASEPHVSVACRLSVAGLQTLLHVLSPLVCPNQEDAHEPAASTQLSPATPSSTSLTVSRSRTNVVSSPNPSGVFVPPADLGDLTPGHADGSQDHAAPRLSGGARVFVLAPDKITKYHREREAYVSVRQSTLKQVQQNQESRHNQYALVQRAIDLGWLPERIHLIDCDLGQSGQDSQRPGFQSLVAAVSLGKVGLILAYEASRLARNNTDWYTLLDLATVVGVLIADTEGIYDPRDYNDRLLLGLRGDLGEAELHTLRLRMDAGRQRQIEQGRNPQHVPTGLVRLEDGRVSKTPDVQVQRTIELVFARFETLGSWKTSPA
jgi:DNA invertase Pin-like site-specific DNA recombinase